MAKLQSLQDLTHLREQAKKTLRNRQRTMPVILIGLGTCGAAAGAKETLAATQLHLAARKINAQVSTVGCLGMCVKEPLVEIQMPGQGSVLYANITSDMAARLIDDFFQIANHVTHTPVGILVDRIQAA